MLRQVTKNECDKVREFYRTCVPIIEEWEFTGYKKGFFPDSDEIRTNVESGEVYALENEDGFVACLIVNTRYNEAFDGCAWSISCEPEEMLIPHSLIVRPNLQGKGYGKQVVRDLIQLAKDLGKKTIRLDAYGINPISNKLYAGMGFRFVEKKLMYYPDAGWAENNLYEYIL